jgi:hypothetical protein
MPLRALKFDGLELQLPVVEDTSMLPTKYCEKNKTSTDTMLLITIVKMDTDCRSRRITQY